MAANYFDQFDEPAPAPAGNFFDQFDAPQQAPEVNAFNVGRGLTLGTYNYLQKQGYGLGQAANDFLTAHPALDWMSPTERQATGQQFMQERARLDQQAQGLEPAIQSKLGAGVYHGAQSLLQQAPLTAAGIATGSAALPLVGMGLGTAGEAYGRYRQRGGTPGQAALGAGIEGVTEVATELLPMKYVVGKFGKAGFGEFLAGTLGREIPGEMIATLVQSASDAAIANPNMTFQQWAQGLPADEYDTVLATLTQSLLTAGLGHGVNRLTSNAPTAPAGNPDMERFRQQAGLGQGLTDLTANPYGQALPQLTGPSGSIQTPAPDFVVDPYGRAVRPGEALPEDRGLPAPQPTGQWQVSPEGTVAPLGINQTTALDQQRQERAALGLGQAQQIRSRMEAARDANEPDPFAPKAPADRVSTDPALRQELSNMANEAGWAEVGGRLIVDQATGRKSRTQWLPKADWWNDMPRDARGLLLGEKGVRIAVNKAILGQPLNAKERTVVDFMSNIASQRVEMSDQFLQAARGGESFAARPPNVGQLDLLSPEQSDTLARQNALEAHRRRREAARTGDVSIETGNPADLFSQARKQIDLTDKTAFDIRRTVAGLTQRWGQNAPGVNIVEDASKLPDSVKSAVGEDVLGATDLGTGQVYLNAAAIKDPATAQRVLAHEAVGHYGLQRLLGDRWDSFLGEVQTLARTDPRLRTIAEGVTRDYSGVDANTHAAETIARLAETNPQHGLVKRAVAAVREAMRRLGFNVKLSYNDSVALLRRAAKYNEGGGAVGTTLKDGVLAAREKPRISRSSPELADTKVVNESGQPMVVYHGTQRLDRVTGKLKKGRATSGPMPFFTSDPQTASGYASGKQDTSLAKEDVWSSQDMFRFKEGRSNVPLMNAWWRLSPEQRATITERAPHITSTDEQDMIYDEKATTGLGNYDYEIKAARGNALQALVESWINSGHLIGYSDHNGNWVDREAEFLKVLKMAGLDTRNVEYDNPRSPRSGVLPVYLNIKKPFETSTLVAPIEPGSEADRVLNALEAASKRKRGKSIQQGADPWDKSVRSGRDWIEQLHDDILSGNTTAWTSIPDWVTQALQSLGYDGIKDTGGKYSGLTHDVWIPFDPKQVVSSISGHILASRMTREGVPGAGTNAPEQQAEIPSHVETGGGRYSMGAFAGLSENAQRAVMGVMEAQSRNVAHERRGTRTQEQTQAAANRMLDERLGTVLNTLVNRKIGSVANAEQTNAYVQVALSTAQDVAQAAERLNATGSNEDLAALGAAKERLGMVLAPLMGYRTEAGRSLAQWRQVSANVDQLSQLWEMLGDGQANALRDFAKRVKGKPLSEVLATTKAAYAPTLFDQVREYWINSILSGPWTHAVNITSNAVFQPLEAGAELAASAVSKDISTRSALARFKGMWAGRTLAVLNLQKAFLTGEPQLNPTMQLEADKHRAIPGRLGEIIRTPGRALTAMDEFFKAIAFTGEMYRMAMDEAQARSPSNPDAVMPQVLEELANDRQAKEKATKYAVRQTFQDELGSWGKGIMHLREQVKPLAFVVPFVKTPTNILKRFTEYSPLAPVMGETRQAMGGKAGPREQALALTRATIGSAFVGSVVAAALNGMVTGGPPDDPRERELWFKAGNQPYSVKVGDTWVQYNRIDPVGMLIGVTADAVQLSKKMSQGQAKHIVSDIYSSLLLNLGNKTYLRGIFDATNAMNDPVRYMQTWAAGMAGSAIPNLAAQGARLGDDYARDARGFIDRAFTQRVPGLRSSLPERLDVSGQPIDQPAGQRVEMARMANKPADPLAEAMLSVGAIKGSPGRTITVGGRPYEFTGDEYESFKSFRQQTIWKVLTPIAASPQFKILAQRNPLAAKDLLESSYDKIARQARDAWLIAHPDVYRKIITQRQQ